MHSDGSVDGSVLVMNELEFLKYLVNKGELPKEVRTRDVRVSSPLVFPVAVYHDKAKALILTRMPALPTSKAQARSSRNKQASFMGLY